MLTEGTTLTNFVSFSVNSHQCAHTLGALPALNTMRLQHPLTTPGFQQGPQYSHHFVGSLFEICI